MTRRPPLSRLALLLGLVLGMTAAAAELAGVPFSAEMAQHGPDGATLAGRMYVDRGRMRVEMSQQGRTLVRILDQDRSTEWILFPEQRRYVEHSVPADAAAALGTPGADRDPCAGMPGLACRKLGQDTLAGRPVTKWEITGSHQGQTFTSVQWLDDERGIPLLQELPNGQRTELRFIGKEELEGRAVEKWETVVTAPDRAEGRTFQWYDPELKLAIKQELPGGVVNELRHIQVGDQPAELFGVPADYARMAPPERTGPPAGAPAGR